MDWRLPSWEPLASFLFFVLQIGPLAALGDNQPQWCVIGIPQGLTTRQLGLVSESIAFQVSLSVFHQQRIRRAFSIPPFVNLHRVPQEVSFSPLPSIFFMRV